MKIFILGLLLLCSCDLDSKKTGLNNCSDSITNSKDNGVFIQKLNINKSVFNIGDNKKDTIKEIWVEDGWTYERSNFSINIKKDSFQQICILSSILSSDAYDKALLLYNHGYFGQQNHVLNSEFFKRSDTIFVVNNFGKKDPILDTLIIIK
jgi:hypothetical protein